MKSTELIDRGIDKRLESLWTAIPANVISTDYSTLTCEIQPKIKLYNDLSREFEDLPIIQGVPIACQKSGDSVLLMPPEIDDVVICLFTKYALDNLLKDTQTSDHGNVRRFSINDCIIVGGLHISTDSIPSIASGETMLYNQSGTYIKMDTDELNLYHKSGAYIKIDSDGDITIHGKTINFTQL